MSLLTKGIGSGAGMGEQNLYQILSDIFDEIADLRTHIAAHTHTGGTIGAGTSAAPGQTAPARRVTRKTE